MKNQKAFEKWEISFVFLQYGHCTHKRTRNIPLTCICSLDSRKIESIVAVLFVFALAAIAFRLLLEHIKTNFKMAPMMRIINMYFQQMWFRRRHTVDMPNDRKKVMYKQYHLDEYTQECPGFIFHWILLIINNAFSFYVQVNMDARVFFFGEIYSILTQVTCFIKILLMYGATHAIKYKWAFCVSFTMWGTHTHAQQQALMLKICTNRHQCERIYCFFESLSKSEILMSKGNVNMLDIDRMNKRKLLFLSHSCTYM